MNGPPKGISSHLAVLAAILAASPGCAPTPLRASFHSPNPTENLYAIEVAMRERDQSAVPHIIEQLDSDDPAVRMMAISALARLTGETHGYVHYAPRHERDEAIRRWIEAYQTAEASSQSSELSRQRSGMRPIQPRGDTEPTSGLRTLTHERGGADD